MNISQQLRAATESALAKGRTRYAIAKGAGVSWGALNKWLDEDRDIRLSTAASLAEYLELELRPRTGGRGK